MTALARWLKFNLVGAAGMLVQLLALALLNRLFSGRYLIATALAVECAVLHNLFWHRRFTWRDRLRSVALRQQVLRFHLSNGLVSLLGNLVLMRVLVACSHLPVTVADALAILACSVANFYLGDTWAFATGTAA